MRVRVKGLGRVICVGAVVAVLSAGCGSQSAEPKDKDWNEESQSEQQSKANNKSEEDKESGQHGKGDKVEVEAGEEGPFRPDGALAKEAEAFVAKYLEAQNSATKDGNFSKVEPMIEKCDVCSASRSTIEEVYDRGGHVEGSLFTDPEVNADSENSGEIGVTVVSKVSAYKVFDASGAEIDDGPAAKETYQYWVARRGGEWKITQGKFVD